MDKTYYFAMLKRQRMFTYKEKERLVCLITFYIGAENDKDKFVRDDMWSLVNDEEGGNICWIDHLITDKNSGNRKLSYKIWDTFKEYIHYRFPRVRIIRWNRYKNQAVKTYKEEILDERISPAVS